MSRNNWYVISGAPSSGKTTIIEMLNERGYTTAVDVARSLINASLSKGISPQELRADDTSFQLEVLRGKLDQERSLDKDSLAFFDCGVHDALAFLKSKNAPVSTEVKNILSRSTYKKAFLLQPLSEYEKDNVRIETKEESARISKLLRGAYLDHNIEVVEVPPLNAKDRLEYILGCVD